MRSDSSQKVLLGVWRRGRLVMLIPRLPQMIDP
jgi:hypothetical protein